MPTVISFRFAAACALAVFMALSAASAAAARTVPVDLRVLTTTGKVLADERQYTSSTPVKTDPGADCFGTGTGGSGDTVHLSGPTALGVLADAAQSNPLLAPLSVTDYDFGFPGLGLCGIGHTKVLGSQFWFLKVNDANPQLSGDQVKLNGGDSVIWYLIPFSKCDSASPYYCPPELVLQAPARAQPGVPFGVHVESINDAGESIAAVGVKIDGAAKPTGPLGNASVVLDRSRRIRATRAKHVPSAPTLICVNSDPSACPRKRGREIFGSSSADRITGTPRPGHDQRPRRRRPRQLRRRRSGPGQLRARRRHGGARRQRHGHGLRAEDRQEVRAGEALHRGSRR